MDKKSKLIFFFLFLSFGLFLFTHPAHAIFGLTEDFWGWLESSLDSLDFVDTTVLNTYFKFLLYLAVGIVGLLMSSALVDWIIKDVPLSLHNDLVLSGWRFIAGLTNLFLILIFVAIALSYILKIETFAAKKALPRLIIVAILINFSLVFMGVFVDIAQLILKGILSALGGGLFGNATITLSMSLALLLIIYAIGFSVYLAVGLIPGANVAAALVLALMATTVLLPWFILSIILLITAIVLSLIFFTLFVFFVFRIAIVWILAIFSPLAFASAILPQTQKYWQKWLNALIEWLSFGIIVVLLAGLGLKLFGSSALLPATNPIDFTISTFTGQLPSFLYNYLFLLAYLGVVYHVTKKYAPALAGVLMGYAAGLASRAGTVAAGVGRELKGGIERRAAEQRKKEEKWREEAEKAKKEGKPPPPKPLSMRVGGALARPVYWAERAYRTMPEIEMRKEMEEAEAELGKKGYTAKELADPALFRTFSRAKKAAALHRAAELEGEKGIKRFRKEDFEEGTRAIYEYGSPVRIKEFKKFARHRLKEKGNEELRKWVDEREVSDEDIKEAKRKGVKVEGKSIDEQMKTKEGREKVYKEIADKKAMEALRAEDYEKITFETANTKEFKETLVKYGRSREGVRRMLEKGILDWEAIEDTIRKIGEIRLGEKLKKEGKTIEDLKREIGEEKTKAEIMEAGRKEVARTNAPILLLSYTPGGYAVGARPFTRPVVIEGKMRPVAIPRSEIQKEIEKAMEEVAKEKEGIIIEKEKKPEEFGKPRKMGEKRGPVPPYE
jgi:hypothetical protein